MSKSDMTYSKAKIRQGDRDRDMIISVDWNHPSMQINYGDCDCPCCQKAKKHARGD